MTTPTSPRSVRQVTFVSSRKRIDFGPPIVDADLTTLSEADFRLVGNSSAVANMSIGQITLNPIKVNVSTSLLGLKGLNGMTTIEKVDVMGGTTSAINLDITGISLAHPPCS
jgi:hypothetical protein